MRLFLPLALAFWTLAAAHAEPWPRTELERPMSLTARTADGETLSGRLAAFDGEGFELLGDEGKSRRVAWRELPAERAYQVLARLLDLKDAGAALRLGELMMTFGEEGKPHAERALRRAEVLDASLAVRIEAVRRGEPDPGDPPPTDGADGDAGETAAATAAAGTPQTQGPIQAQYWGHLSDADQQATIGELNTFATQALARLGSRATLYETDYFLFYSDIPPDEAREWASLLDRMYARLCELFAIPKGENLWRGKCLVFVFANELTYRRFETEIQGLPPSDDAAGRCWQAGDGRVLIAFYRQPSKWIFAHILVHETVHGFLHRYRSPERIPSAWNEGLAEVIANELVPQSPIRERRRGLAASELRDRRNTGGIFAAEQIDGWQYGVASTLTEFMIAQNKKGYVAFINGIKDGLAWEESLTTRYGAPLDRLVRVYGEAMRIRDLRP